MSNITNYLNKVKTAIYGKEVRGAIHDAIKQVYDDASVEHDNANMEVKLARGTHNTLNDRLDNVDEIQAQTNAQLSEEKNKLSRKTISLYYSNFNANSFDDDATVDKIINEIHNFNNDVIVYFDVDTIRLSKPHYISRNNVCLDFMNCTIYWENYESLEENKKRLRSVACFNFIGTETSDKINISNYTLFNDEKHSLMDGDSFFTDEKLNIGDYLFLNIGLNKMVGDGADGLFPYSSYLVKVIDTDENKCVIDYRCFWNEILSNLDGRCYVKKIEPLRNIKVKNLTFVDNTQLPDGYIKSTSNSDNADFDKTHLISALLFEYCTNLELSRIKGEKTKFPVASILSSSNIEVNGLSIENPDMVGGGEGYGVQFSTSRDIIANNLKGINERHLIDFTGVDNAFVSNSYSTTKYQIGFSNHGAYESNITFQNCNGAFQTGNSGSTFGNASRNVTLRTCKGFITTKYCDNLVIDNCDLSIGSLGTTTKIMNSKIDLSFHQKYIKEPLGSNNNRQQKSSLYLFDCDVIDRRRSPNLELYNWDKFEMVGGSYKIIGLEGFEKARLYIHDNKYVHFRDTHFDMHIMILHKIQDKSMIKFQQCTFEATIDDSTIPQLRIYNFENVDLDIDISNNIFKSKKSQTNHLQIDNTGASGENTVRYKCNNNRFIPEKICNGYVKLYAVKNNNSTLMTFDNNYLVDNITLTKEAGVIGENYIQI